MLSTSLDLLYIVLAFCILWLTAFLCWAIYYLVQVLRNTNEMIEGIRARISQIEEAVKKFKEKVDGSVASIRFISEQVENILDLVKKTKTKKREKKEEQE